MLAAVPYSRCLCFAPAGHHQRGAPPPPPPPPAEPVLGEVPSCSSEEREQQGLSGSGEKKGVDNQGDDNLDAELQPPQKRRRIDASEERGPVDEAPGTSAARTEAAPVASVARAGGGSRKDGSLRGQHGSSSGGCRREDRLVAMDCEMCITAQV